ncbi:MAG: APC family permease [Bacteroidetes bacterium]|nr:APC family permease [Bacteroidota bacterium]
MDTSTGLKKIKTIVVGGARDPHDQKIFHKLSLIAFLAWVGLGSDGLSSSCYGPAEAFKALGGHPYLGIFVALGTGITIFIIAASYSHIIELFPSGGGGYLVASKLLSPNIGMVSGCALLIDYVLTITISIASGADAIFSFLPQSWHVYKLEFAVFGVIVLLLLNLRGIKEAVIPLVPVFLLFVFTHLFAIVYAIASHAVKFHEVYNSTGQELSKSFGTLGVFGVLFLVMRAYSMGAGTFTGIEAVSNGLPILREPRVATAKRTMHYMAFSLSITVIGLMIAYLLFKVEDQPGKTLNAILFENMSAAWGGHIGFFFVLITLLSEAILLFIAAQTGFLDGPRVLANMAIDRWFPTRFAMLSDRLVTQNGILLMGITSLIMMFVSKGSVDFLIVLYSINVFITFSLSQLGMVKHWWQVRNSEKNWLRKLSINGVGLILTSFILFSVLIIKFGEGGWITLVITAGLVALTLVIKKHYLIAADLLRRLDTIVDSVEASIYNIQGDNAEESKEEPKFDPQGKTAAILVNGFNGLGLHTLLSVFRLFGGTYKNYVFLQVGSVDAGNFKGADEIENLDKHIDTEANRYVKYMKEHNYYAEAFTSVGTDVVDEINNIVPKITSKFHNVVFFGGQLVFPEESFMTKWLHNYIVFAVQRKFYRQGIPFVILPIRV